ncbi:helix-turn-helix domain-containing protein [Streptomyces litchfieldiae]|uniref:Helix-turn-helix domain-containing protein n=1 Tax=Streptomyces litchfieldiae TaxID=3075543 RepID=A0ABU2MKR1_9ACTN|nr:helix-turn-helix domain-containing protein [Streptomyces sp. DSM 44938]MDT0342184.1 helix-turn-helix domain-containing protein [Streptomyces sp. DSM 44938]
MYRERPSLLGGDAVVWDNAPVAPGVGRVLPDGCMDLIWSAGTLLVAGPDTRAHLVERAVGHEHVGLRFAPGTGPAVFGVPADELTDLRVPLADLWPPDRVRELLERVAAAPDPGAALEAVAGERLSRAEPPAGVGGGWRPAAVEALRRGAGVGATARQLGLSERQLRRRCLVAFGYGPKTLTRVLRMQRALELARDGVPLATAAARAGYADQPHLAREVRALAGVPVTELLEPA